MVLLILYKWGIKEKWRCEICVTVTVEATTTMGRGCFASRGKDTKVGEKGGGGR